MGVKQFNFEIRGTHTLMFGRPIHDAKEDDETHEQKDARTWRQRAAVNDSGHLFISAVAVHRSILFAARWLAIKLEGKKTYTKRFESGMLPTSKQEFILTKNGIPLGAKAIIEKPLFVPANGKKNGQTRVWKSFPIIPPGWQLAGEFIVTDEALGIQMFERHLKTSGAHDGLGSMRIGNGGPNGGFIVEKVEESELVI